MAFRRHYPQLHHRRDSSLCGWPGGNQRDRDKAEVFELVLARVLGVVLDDGREARHAEVPLPMLTGLSLPTHAALSDALEAGCNCAEEGHGHDHAHTHDHDHDHPGLGAGLSHGDIFETWSSRPTRVFSLAELKNQMKTPPPGLLRLKGFVATGLQDPPDWYELQFAGKYASLHKVPSPSPSLQAGVVAIGLCGQLPRNLLADFFG